MWPNNVPIMNFKSGANKMSAALLKQRLKPQKEGHWKTVWEETHVSLTTNCPCLDVIVFLSDVFIVIRVHKYSGGKTGRNY